MRFELAFRTLRLGGWASPEVRSFAETIGRRYAQHSSSSSGIRLVLEFNHIFWAALMPKVQPMHAPPVDAIMELLEPMCTTAARSSLDSLVGSIHNQILRRIPAEFCNALLSQLLRAASQKETPVKQQAALNETIEVLRSRNAVSDDAACETDPRMPSCSSVSENSDEASAGVAAAEAAAAADKKSQSSDVRERRTRKRRLASKSPDIPAMLEVDPVQTPKRKRRRKVVVSPGDSNRGSSGDVAEKSNQEPAKGDASAAKAKAAVPSEPARRASALRTPKRRLNSSVAQSPRAGRTQPKSQSPHARAVRNTMLGDAARHVVFDLEATEVVRYSESKRVALQVKCVLRKPAAPLP